MSWIFLFLLCSFARWPTRLRLLFYASPEHIVSNSEKHTYCSISSESIEWSVNGESSFILSSPAEWTRAVWKITCRWTFHAKLLQFNICENQTANCKRRSKCHIVNCQFWRFSMCHRRNALVITFMSHSHIRTQRYIFTHTAHRTTSQSELLLLAYARKFHKLASIHLCQMIRVQYTQKYIYIPTYIIRFCAIATSSPMCQTKSFHMCNRHT